ncbi:MAG: peptidoglycan DD-metalloendopeptidase family protein [Pseudomonadota bacterium]|jgi:murein DD-endopeptidase MepM/ murein hydrolase activator NlpD
MTSKILPDLDISQACRVNLNDAARDWYYTQGCQEHNALLVPTHTQALIDNLQARNGATWSYGGYLEDRSCLLRGSYLDATGGYIHLGIDINVPPGVRVVAPFNATIVNMFNDGDEPQGWGLRLILRPADTYLSYLVLGHVAGASVKVGDYVTAGEEIAHIAAPPFNGNWFPHLHIQQIASDVATIYERDNYDTLDGYGHPSELEKLQRDYPDPSWLVVATT